MKIVWLVLGISLLFAFIVFFVRSRGGEMAMSADLNQKIVQPYVKAVAARDYPSAYELLSDGYRTEVSLEKFTGALEKRRAEKGAISSCRLIRDEVSHTLFSSKRTVRLLCELDYGGQKEIAWIILQEAEKDHFAIEGTYYESAGESLNFIVW